MRSSQQKRLLQLLGGPLIFGILLLLPMPFLQDYQAQKVLALATWMIFWWVTEVVGLAVTALLPLAVLPLLGIFSMKEAAAPYSNPVIYLFMGGFVIALAMEKWQLHLRIALNIVRITGTNANGIIWGFMLATALLSMWISNTATTVMMLPIATSVINLLTTNDRPQMSGKGHLKNFALCLMLGVAFAANVGGTATITGTPPNSVMVGYLYEAHQIEISFARWMLVGVPFALVMLVLIYFFLVKVIYPNHLGQLMGSEEIIGSELEKLGKMSYEEKTVSILFASTALCWIFRQQIIDATGLEGLSDAGIAVVGAVAMFMAPTKQINKQAILSWPDTKRLPWGILILFGGGMSLAQAMAEVGIITQIGQFFSENVATETWLLLLGLTATSLFLTELMSNVALTAVFVPVVAAIALGLGEEITDFVIPVTLATSCAFMLPMATPPNAIVFASGHISVGQMVKAGFWLNITSVLLLIALGYWLVPLVF